MPKASKAATPKPKKAKSLEVKPMTGHEVHQAISFEHVPKMLAAHGFKAGKASGATRTFTLHAAGGQGAKAVAAHKGNASMARSAVGLLRQMGSRYQTEDFLTHPHSGTRISGLKGKAKHRGAGPASYGTYSGSHQDLHDAIRKHPGLQSREGVTPGSFMRTTLPGKGGKGKTIGEALGKSAPHLLIGEGFKPTTKAHLPAALPAGHKLRSVHVRDTVSSTGHARREIVVHHTSEGKKGTNHHFTLHSHEQDAESSRNSAFPSSPFHHHTWNEKYRAARAAPKEGP